MKKLLGIFVLVSVLFVGVQSAKASTLEDLYAQITALSQQVSSLKSELSAAVALTRPTSPCGAMAFTVTATDTSTQTIKPGQKGVVLGKFSLKQTSGDCAIYINGATFSPSLNVSKWVTSDGVYSAQSSTNGVFGYVTKGMGLITITLTGDISQNASGSINTSLNSMTVLDEMGYAVKITGMPTRSKTLVIDSKPTERVVATTTSTAPLERSSNPNPDCTATTAPWIKVLSPNTGNEVYVEGQDMLIKWSSCNFTPDPSAFGSEIKIGIQSQGNPFVNNLTFAGAPYSSLSSSGQAIISASNITQEFAKSYPSAVFPYGKNFKVSISRNNLSAQLPYLGDFSDNLFTIKAYSDPNPTTPVSPTTGTSLILSKNLAPGATGNDVQKLQDFLVSAGYLKKDDSIGIYGNKTVNAVKAWQRENGLGADGKVGPKTREALKRSSNSCTAKTAPWIKVTYPKGGEVYKIGQKVDVGWTSCNIEEVYLSLHNGGKDMGLFSEAPILASKRSYIWTVPNSSWITQENVHTGYWIGVESSNQNVLAKSGLFSIN